MKLNRIAFSLMLSLPVTPTAQPANHDHVSPYAGQETRTIKGLSEEDLAELRRGGGWGLAKAAELNGVPGPSHVLKMTEDLGMTLEQASRVRDVFERMQRAAVAEGGNLISLEEELERRFRAGKLDPGELREQLDRIEESRGELRYVHLSAHLEMAGILTPEQVVQYNALRGYRSTLGK